jgi:hypothetical protein
MYIPSIYIDMEELFTLPEHLSSPPVFSWVRVALSLVFCVVFCRSSKEKGQKKTKNNDLQNTTQKTKDRATRTQLKTGGELRCSDKAVNKWIR